MYFKRCFLNSSTSQYALYKNTILCCNFLLKAILYLKNLLPTIKLHRHQSFHHHLLKKCSLLTRILKQVNLCQNTIPILKSQINDFIQEKNNKNLYLQKRKLKIIFLFFHFFCLVCLLIQSCKKCFALCGSRWQVYKI